MTKLYSIGEVCAYRNVGPKPWKKLSLMGDERVEALTALRNDKDAYKWFVFYVWNPLRKVTAEEVNWKTSGIEESK